jgi:phenazine biosynthesis protein phzE
MIDLSKPFAVIQKEDAPTVLVLSGPVKILDLLAQIPRSRPAEDRAGASRQAQGRRYDTLSLIPFSQIREKGFEARQGDENLPCMSIESQQEVSVVDFLAWVPKAEIVLDGETRFDESEDAFREAVRRIVVDEIGEGEGANFVHPRTARAQLKGYSPAVALNLLKRLIQADYGTYWKYVFYDGQRTFVGSTPEKHLSVDKGRVVMNPISGTFRKAGFDSPKALRQGLMDFLRDPKEINELFMVVDEELKMMSKRCEKGGMIVGPLLKEMSRLVHSEYLLVGESGRDVVDLLRESLFAATVTGSPVENACHIIARHESQPRRYYASSIALIGRDEDGEAFLDSPILIRSLEIDAQGAVQLRVGATLVRDSKPDDEVAETKAKSAAVLSALREEPVAQPRVLDQVQKDALVVERLFERNQKLSTFWFNKQDPTEGHGPLEGALFELIDNEDDFLAMFGHMLAHLGARVNITSWKHFDLSKVSRDAVVVPGPGPGNPQKTDDPKMALNGRVIDQLLKEKRPFLAVCLGHQVLCQRLGLKMGKKAEVAQGVQKRVDYFGRQEDVGFYNTFCGFADVTRPDLHYSADPSRGEIHALRGAHFASFQFHPESILTRNGYAIVEEAARRVLGRV